MIISLFLIKNSLISMSILLSICFNYITYFKNNRHSMQLDAEKKTLLFQCLLISAYCELVTLHIKIIYSLKSLLL